MADPLFKRRRVTAAKIETTPGTAIALAAADATWPAYNSMIQREIDFIETMPQGAFSPILGNYGPLGGIATFSVSLQPGSGALPAWASILLPACGFPFSGNVASPSSAPAGAAVKTLTIATYQGPGKVKKIRGAAGNAEFVFPAGRPAYVDFTFRGIYDPPADTAILAPDFDLRPALRAVSSGLTIGAWAPRWNELRINLGNQLKLLEDGNDPSGFGYCAIVNRRITGTIDPEAPLVAGKNIWNEILALTEQAMAINLASGGIGVAFALPKIQFTDTQEGDREDVETETVSFQANRNADVGDDELTITFDHTP